MTTEIELMRSMMSSEPPNFRDNNIGCWKCKHVKLVVIRLDEYAQEELRCKKYSDYLVRNFQVCDDYEAE